MDRIFIPVLLPTDGGARLFLNKSDGVLMGPTVHYCAKLSNMVIPQHIYIPSNEQGELNDWVYCDVTREVFFVNEINEKTGLARDKNHYPFILDGCKKIVATSDPKVFSLVVRNGPASISTDDLKKLVDLYIVDEGVFTSIKVQYEPGKDISNGILAAKDIDVITLKYTHIVINWKDEVSYSSAEVDALCRDAFALGQQWVHDIEHNDDVNPMTINDWIKEKLTKK